MTELTPEERQRIYEEEKARLEARTQIESEATAEPKKTPAGCGTIFLILGALVVVAYLINYFSSKPSLPSFPLTGTAETSAPRDMTPPLTVTTNKFSIGAYDNYEVVGEVKNVSSKTFHFVEVKAEFLNAAGTVVGTDMAYACGQDYILPGGTKSFKMLGTNQPDYKKVRVSIDSYTEVR
jgi:hypothetical protein